MISKINRADLIHLRELMETGQLTPVIDRVYHGLNEIPAAIGYLEEGRARGKVVAVME
jgi:NADPH:quinone reductase-like Zn-dependent oxidoreductase